VLGALDRHLIKGIPEEYLRYYGCRDFSIQEKPVKNEGQVRAQKGFGKPN